LTQFSCASARRLTLALPLAILLAQVPVALHAQSTPAQQPAPMPDAPTPQAPAPLSDVKTQVTPGSGTAETLPDAQPADTKPAPPPAAPDTVQGEAPVIGSTTDLPTFVQQTNAVEVPVTVKDAKGNLVAGLTYRDFRVFENNKQQRIAFFTVDPFPLSIAFVIDQSLEEGTMAEVNRSLGALQGALTPYDDVAVFSYNNGAKDLSGGFTGAQSHRLEAVLQYNKAVGRDPLVPVTSGPLAGCPITSNGDCVNPVIQQGGSTGGAFVTLPKEKHTLNDAILLAAQELAKRPQGRRRILYVVSDGKEYGSKATTKEVLKYLQTNKIAVYATLVGDSARWGEGYLSRFHIPFQMNDNILTKYTLATGGSLDSEKNTNGIEKSYQHIAEEARFQYTLVYYSHEPTIDGKYRTIDVRVDRPSKEVEVTAKPGYYPTAENLH
jgi:VWFA-related protein